MGLRDLLAANASLLRDPGRGFGEQVTYFDPAFDPPRQTPINAIVEFLPTDPFLRTTEVEEIIEQGTVDLPASIEISMHGWFIRANGEKLKITGRGGRDDFNQTIAVNCVKTMAKKIARRRGT
ncbi:MAG: hypothetical protein V4719_26640 [Planctomycetota bacterium]